MTERENQPCDYHALRAMLDERDRRYEEKFASLLEQRRVYEIHAEAWRAQANEWRAAMTDRERTFLPRSIGFILGALSVISLILTLERMIHP